MGKSRDSRFLKKILTDAETEYVVNAVKPDTALWSFWACKETAYKVIKKYLPDAPFVPRRWQTVFSESPSGYLEGAVGILGKGEIYIRLFSNSDYVHCVGSDNVETLNQLTWRVEMHSAEDKTDPSIYLRHLLRQSLAKRFLLDFRRITIKRTKKDGELQPPYVYVAGRKTDIDVSLSHDGRFLAYAFNDIR